MNAFTFRQQWDAWYPDSLPVGYLLRQQHPERWLRIYSLPGGQRYPKTDGDWGELLTRHLTAADVVLGDASECALIVAAFVGDHDDGWFGERFALEPLELASRDSLEGGSDLEDPEEPAIDLWLATVVWEPQVFEPAIRQTADDHGPRFLLAALGTGHVYAPYDGGADLFAPDARGRAQFRTTLRAWVSPRRDGH